MLALLEFDILFPLDQPYEFGVVRVFFEPPVRQFFAVITAICGSFQNLMFQDISAG